MHKPADTATRVQFIAALRELADYLARNPDIPVPPYGDIIHVNVNRAEAGGTWQVREIASALGTRVRDETATGGRFYADKHFGPLVYRVVSIPERNMARSEALWSYLGCVDPQ